MNGHKIQDAIMFCAICDLLDYDHDENHSCLVTPCLSQPGKGKSRVIHLCFAGAALGEDPASCML